MTGHIVKRGDAYRVTVDLGKDPITGKRSRASGTARTKREAIRLGESLARASRPGDRSRTVGYLLDEWLAFRKEDWSPSTYIGAKSKVETWLKPNLGELPLRQLTPDRIDGLYRRMRTEPNGRGAKLSGASVRRTHAALSAACEQAVKWGWLAANPCKRASPGKARRPTVNPPSFDEVRRIVEHGPVVALALATGARRGELCGIQWGDIDFEAATITIRRSVVQLKGGTETIEDQRKSPVRTVSIPEETVAMLRERYAEQAAFAKSEKAALLPTAYVLGEMPGQVNPLYPERVTGRWRDAAKAAGSTARFHDIRHAHLTKLLAAGIPVGHVGRRAGHADGGRVLMSVYSHAVAELDRQSADVVGAALQREA